MNDIALAVLIGAGLVLAFAIFWLQEQIHARHVVDLQTQHDHELGVMAEAHRTVEANHWREIETSREQAAEWSHLMRHTVEDGIAANAALAHEHQTEREQLARLIVSASDPVNYGALARASRISDADVGIADLRRQEVLMASRLGVRPPTPERDVMLVTPEGDEVSPVGMGG